MRGLLQGLGFPLGKVGIKALLERIVVITCLPSTLVSLRLVAFETCKTEMTRSTWTLRLLHPDQGIA
jgi:hypothetical protein